MPIKSENLLGGDMAKDAKVSFSQEVANKDLPPEEQIWDKPKNFPKHLLAPLFDEEKEI